MNNSLQAVFAVFGGERTFLYYAASFAGFILALWASYKIYMRHGNLAAGFSIGLSSAILSPISWAHHYVYLIPAIFYCFFSLGKRLLSVLLYALVLVHDHYSVFSEALPPIWVLTQCLYGVVSVAVIATLYATKANKPAYERAQFSVPDYQAPGGQGLRIR